MSFILDALRRAEDGRQNVAIARPAIESVSVPAAPPNNRRRLLLLGAALGVALLAVAAASLFDRPPEPGAATTTPNVSVVEVDAAVARRQAAPTRTLRQEVVPATARKEPVRALAQEGQRPDPERVVARSAPAREHKRRGGTVTVMPAPTETPSAPAAEVPAPEPAKSEPPAANDYGALPEYKNVRLDAKVRVPALRMDMHVYNRVPEKRFVFINLKKYREGERVDNKAEIEAITPSGAVLNSNGFSFLLKPE